MKIGGLDMMREYQLTEYHTIRAVNDPSSKITNKNWAPALSVETKRSKKNSQRKKQEDRARD